MDKIQTVRSKDGHTHLIFQTGLRTFCCGYPRGWLSQTGEAYGEQLPSCGSCADSALEMLLAGCPMGPGLKEECPAVTKKGSPCQGRAQPDTGYCTSHWHLAETVAV